MFSVAPSYCLHCIGANIASSFVFKNTCMISLLNIDQVKFIDKDGFYDVTIFFASQRLPLLYFSLLRKATKVIPYLAS